MRFPYRELHGLGDVQNNFEQLEGMAILDKLPTNFLQLLSAQQLQVAVGSTIQALAAATAGTFTVAHGIGRAPGFAVAVPDGSVANDLTIGTANPTNTNFTVTWRRASGVAAGFNIGFWWIAIG